MYFSVALDESCDVQDKPQLANFARSVSEDCVIKEELLDIVPLKERTRGVDVKETMTDVFVKVNLPLQKLTAIATPHNQWRLLVQNSGRAQVGGGTYRW